MRFCRVNPAWINLDEGMWGEEVWLADTYPNFIIASPDTEEEREFLESRPDKSIYDDAELPTGVSVKPKYKEDGK